MRVLCHVSYGVVERTGVKAGPCRGFGDIEGCGMVIPYSQRWGEIDV